MLLERNLFEIPVYSDTLTLVPSTLKAQAVQVAMTDIPRQRMSPEGTNMSPCVLCIESNSSTTQSCNNVAVATQARYFAAPGAHVVATTMDGIVTSSCVTLQGCFLLKNVYS